MLLWEITKKGNSKGWISLCIQNSKTKTKKHNISPLDEVILPKKTTNVQLTHLHPRKKVDNTTANKNPWRNRVPKAFLLVVMFPPQKKNMFWWVERVVVVQEPPPPPKKLRFPGPETPKPGSSNPSGETRPAVSVGILWKNRFFIQSILTFRLHFAFW